MSEDILYKPEEIAQKLKLTKGTVYEMIKRGELEAHRIGRYIRISDTQFKNYLLKSRGYENIFEAALSSENDEIIANIGSVKIHVNTALEGIVKVSISAEDIILSKSSFVSSARNIYKGVVTDIIQDGNSASVILHIGITLTSLITSKSLKEMDIKKGDELYAVFKTMSVKVYK